MCNWALHATGRCMQLGRAIVGRCIDRLLTWYVMVNGKEGSVGRVMSTSAAPNLVIRLVMLRSVVSQATAPACKMPAPKA